MSDRKHVVVLTGAGVSAESGLKTFRGSGGLWENEPIEAVATPEAWEHDPARVLRFYNARRAAMRAAQPNAAHNEVARWEQTFLVSVVTQNVDDLHERAGSTRVLHLHGELRKARSSGNPDYICDLGNEDIALGDVCPEGHQLRPHIVWFGEEVPLFAHAVDIVESADMLVVIGTSLQVYPAAQLAFHARRAASRFLIDPDPPAAPGFEILQMNASDGTKEVGRILAGKTV